MRHYLAKAIAVVLLATFFGLPMGLYNQKLREDARAMTQEQWLDMMEYTQSSYEYSMGFTGSLIFALVGCAGLVCIYEFTKLVAGMLLTVEN